MVQMKTIKRGRRYLCKTPISLRTELTEKYKFLGNQPLLMYVIPSRSPSLLVKCEEFRSTPISVPAAS